MKRYRFYIAWMAHSDGACGDDTKIDSADDLIPQHKAGNEHVIMWEFDARDEQEAIAIGRGKAFMDNWTAQDTVTDLEEVESGANNSREDLIMVLNDHETFTGLGGCHIMRVTNDDLLDDDKGVKFAIQAGLGTRIEDLLDWEKVDALPEVDEDPENL